MVELTRDGYRAPWTDVAQEEILGWLRVPADVPGTTNRIFRDTNFRFEGPAVLVARAQFAEPDLDSRFNVFANRGKSLLNIFCSFFFCIFNKNIMLLI